MKLNKLLIPALSISAIGISLAPSLTSCTDNSKNSVEVVGSSSTTIARNSKSMFFRFKQSNLDNAIYTEVKIANLYVNGAKAAVIDGLIDYDDDSAGNIRVDLDLETLKQHYGYNFSKLVLDFEFNNDKANTNHTVSVEVNVDDSAVAINYSDDCKNVSFDESNPKVSYAKEDVIIKYSINTGTFKSATILIGDIDRTSRCTITDSQITVPAVFIDDNITITVIAE